MIFYQTLLIWCEKDQNIACPAKYRRILIVVQ